MADRPRISLMLNSLANYNVSIPSAPDKDVKAPQARAKLGTLLGVYLPCIQNIFGVILFIRMPWIVGTAGSILSFTLVLMCCCTVSLKYKSFILINFKCRNKKLSGLKLLFLT